MTLRLRITLLVGCFGLGLLEAPPALNAARAGWRGPYRSLEPPAPGPRAQRGGFEQAAVDAAQRFEAPLAGTTGPPAGTTGM